MTADYVRRYYGVPAKRGIRVVVDGRPGVVAGFSGQYLRVRFDDWRWPLLVHPTWRVEYLTEDGGSDDQ